MQGTSESSISGFGVTVSTSATIRNPTAETSTHAASGISSIMRLSAALVSVRVDFPFCIPHSSRIVSICDRCEAVSSLLLRSSISCIRLLFSASIITKARAPK